MIGHTLGHHRVLERIGAGGMGEVYRARDERLERDVALKVLRAGALADEDMRKRFRKEALALSRLNHPNIETIHEFDTQDGLDFLVMEYVTGVTLSDTLAQGPLAERELLHLGTQLAEGLAAAHEQGIVHRDVKPGNLRVTPSGRLKILDFGLARLLTPETSVTAATTEIFTGTQTLAGTLPYMSPEQLQGAHIDHRSDIWAAGVVLYEMATGRRPFDGQLVSDVIVGIQTQAPTPPSRVGAGVSPGLERVILGCLEKDPARRYQTAGDLLADLRRLEVGTGANASGADAGASEPEPRRGRQKRWNRVAVWVPLGLLVLGAVLGLLTARGAWKGGSTAPPQPAIASLAVLPLTSLSGQPAQDFVADGLHEALITELSKIGAVRVISRTSTLRFKGQSLPLAQLGRELSVDAVIEGSVLRSGNRLRVSVQLIKVDPEQHLWADSFDREFSDVLYLTSEVAQSVAREIRVTLTPTERARLARARPVNSQAYEEYVRGRHFWNQRSIEGYRQAVGSFRRAIELDSGYAPAHAGLGEVYMLLGEQGGMSTDEARTLASAAIDKALDLDPDLAEAHSALGLLKFYWEWDWAAADAAFRHAIALNPGYAAAHQLYGRALGFLGRHDDCRRELQRARELDPLSAIVQAYSGQAFIQLRQYDRAAADLESSAELNPNHALIRHNLAEVYLAQGRHDDALDQALRSVELSREPSLHYRAILGAAYAMANRRTEASSELKELTSRSKQGLVSDVDMALLETALGNRDAALTWLERGSARRDPWLAQLKGWPWFDSLAAEPRYQAVLERLRFPR